jgi:hypothetical protein
MQHDRAVVASLELGARAAREALSLREMSAPFSLLIYSNKRDVAELIMCFEWYATDHGSERWFKSHSEDKASLHRTR